MTIETYPTSPVPTLDYQLTSQFKTIHSQYDSSIEQSQRMWRFPIHNLPPLKYEPITQNERDTLFEFWRKKHGDWTRFWFFDFLQRKWFDQYVGRGGAIDVEGFIADDGGNQTNETEEANDDTANDMTLLPAVPAVNDATYYCGFHQYDKIGLQIGTAGNGNWTLAYEYQASNSAWVALSSLNDSSNRYRSSGNHTITFTVPTNWMMNNVGNIEGYWTRTRVTGYSAITTQPKGTRANLSTKTYDLPSKNTSNNATLKVYVDGVEKTGNNTDYVFVSGNGAGNADRIQLVAYQNNGALITTDFQGQLRMFARFDEQDKFHEKLISAGPIYSVQLGVREVRK